MSFESSGEVTSEMWLSRRLLKDRAVRGLPLAGVVTVAGATLVEVCVAATQVNFGAIYPGFLAKYLQTLKFFNWQRMSRSCSAPTTLSAT